MMRVVLKADVRGVGRRHDVKEVADGYARNFLIPRGLAEPADAAAVQRVAELTAHRAQEREAHEARAREEVARLAALPIEFRARAGEKHELFGSVTPEDIAEFLKTHGITEVRKVETPPLRALGPHRVTLDFGEGIKETVTVTVSPLE